MALNLQAEAKKLEDAGTYLSLPSTKAELEEKGHSATGRSMQSLGSCTISKDSFQISTLVCSTKLTQNGGCAAWEAGRLSARFLLSSPLSRAPCWMQEVSLGAGIPPVSPSHPCSVIACGDADDRGKRVGLTSLLL